MSRFGKILVLAAGVAMFAIPAPANAAGDYRIRFYEDLGSDPTSATPFLKEVIDNNVPSGDLDPNFGRIIVGPNYAVGDFTIFLTTSITNANDGQPGFPPLGPLAHLEIGHTTITNTNSLSPGTHTLSVFVTSTDYTQPGFVAPMDVKFTASGSINAGSNSTGHYIGYADASNTAFGTGTAAPTINFALPDGSGNRSFSATTQTSFTDTLPLGYSMSILGVFSLNAGGSYSGNTGNLDASAVPAPGALALALAAFPCLGFGWLRRRK